MHRVLCLLLLLATPAFAQDARPLPTVWPDTLVIELEPRPEHGPFYMLSGIGQMHERERNPEALSYSFGEDVEGVPDSLAGAQVLFHDFDFAQLTYQAYRQGLLAPERAHRAFANWRADTLAFTSDPVDARVAVLIARTDSQYVFLFDTDNDESFVGETPVRAPLARPADFDILSSGIEQEVAYEFFDGRQIRTATAPLRVQPYISPPIPDVPAIYLSGVHQHFAAETKTPAGDTLLWFASRNTRDGRFTPRNTRVLFFTEPPADARTERILYEPYRTGEVVDLGGAFYQLMYVTPGGERIVLVRTEKVASVGLRTGMEAPDFAALTLAGDSLRLSNLRGKYVLLEFWGTWCGPCVGEVPNLKEAYTAYSGETFEIVGIAQDGVQEVADFVAEREMPWPQIVQDVEQDRAILDAFRIQGFPTTILVGPGGRIVARESALRGPGLMQTLRQHLGRPTQPE